MGLALVVEGKIVLGAMGCPNWKEVLPLSEEHDSGLSGSGLIMISHVGCGTWKRDLLKYNGNPMEHTDVWRRCFVDSCHLVHAARFCIPDSQTWETMPLSAVFSSTLDNSGTKSEQDVLLVPTCCGR